MNRKQQRTLNLIFSVPTPASTKFSDIEKLLIALGAVKIEGSGSRAAFVMPNLLKWEARRPHSQKETKKYQVESVRVFLERLGLKNE